MSALWQGCLTLVAFAVFTTLCVPQLVRRQSWYLHRPLLVLNLWFLALASSLGALGIAGVLAVLAVSGGRVAGIRDSAHLDRALSPLELSVWASVIVTGALVAAVGARARRLSIDRQQLRSDLRCLSASHGYRTEHRSGCTVTFLRTDDPIACSLAGHRPQVFISSGLEHQLAPDVLDAVVEHEIAHLRQHHDVPTYLAELAVACTPWIPASRELRRSTALLIEFIADDRACCASAPASLSSALTTMSRAGGGQLCGLRAERITPPA